MTLKKRIFLTNTIMVLVCLFLLLVIVEVLTELLFEHYLGVSISALIITLASGKWVAFVTVFGVLGLLAVIGLLLISQIFTWHLTRHIMEPMSALMAGAERMDAGDLSQPIDYVGEVEFEQVCGTFNTMQQHLKEGMDKDAANERARTELVTGISHDLRTPLTAVKGYLKGLLDGVAKTPEKRQLYIQGAYSRACEMESLLSRLFYYSKLQTGSMPMFPVDLEMERFLTTYAADAARRYPAVHFLVEPSETPLWVRLDPDQMLRILDNLINNSIAYGGVKPLSIRFRVGKKEHAAVLIVKDNGLGLPAEKLPLVFDEFYRGDTARSDGADSNGLGLYIVKTLVEAQGGQVQAASEKGFEVMMTFPMVEDTEGGKNANLNSRG